ncbi:hypothetical protein LguiA_023491 [Lonicera macranthoides]
MSNRKGGGGGGFPDRLPNSIIVNEILLKLDLDTLSCVACVSPTLRSSVYQARSSLSSLDLSAFSPDIQTLNRILSRFGELKSVAVDCLRLIDSSILLLLGTHLHQLNLFKCSSLSYQLVASIGHLCPNLRVLVLEMTTSGGSPNLFNTNLVLLLERCLYLESLSIKIRGTELDEDGFESIELFLPKTLKILKLKPMLESNAVHFIHEARHGRNFTKTSSNLDIPLSLDSHFSALQCLSLVLDTISDQIIFSIVNSLPLLLELDLEDRPTIEPSLPRDLTNGGLQSLGSCHRLTNLSLARGRQNRPMSFKRTNDMGMFILSEGCKALESVRLGGFSRVSDAGYAAILHSCHNLKKFEVRNVTMLSDLTFHDIAGAPCSLVEVRLLSCSFITCDSVEKLASSKTGILEILDLCGCRSIADACVTSVSFLSALTTLNLGGADVTDSGMAVLGKGNSPIACLSLRGCKRVTDKGIALLLCDEGAISKTLLSLDVGYMPGISDRAIDTIARFAQALTELCLRYCFFVTDASVKALGSKTMMQDGGKVLLRRLDLFKCSGLSVSSLGWLKKPSFRGLRWVGVGLTRLTCEGDFVLNEICVERPWMTICFDGCEMGCHDGWQFHKVS